MTTTPSTLGQWPIEIQPHLNSWPDDYPQAALNALIDGQFAFGLEKGPRPQWRAWQQRRFSELIDWSTRFLWWNQWLGVVGGKPLRDLPIMSRRDYGAAVASQSSSPSAPEEHGSVLPVNTSGSTAPALAFWTSSMALRMAQAQYLADHLRQGRKPMVPSAQGPVYPRIGVIGASADAHDGDHTLYLMNPLVGTPETLARQEFPFSAAQHAQWLADNPIDHLSVRPNLWALMLDEFEAGRVRLQRPLTQVMSFDDNVDSALRRRTRAATGASIRDRYAAQETGPIAFQCPLSGDHHHVAVGSVIVETVRFNGKPAALGEVGRLLVTGLHNLASPAIRLDVGDSAALHNQCPGCAADVPTLSHLVGRPRFTLRMPPAADAVARHLPLRVAAMHFLACAPVLEHRFLQTAPAAVRVEVVLTAGELLSSEQAHRLTAMLAKEASSHFSWDVVQLPTIDWPIGAERRGVECLLV